MPIEQHSPLPKQERISVKDVIEKLQTDVHISITPCNKVKHLEFRWVTDVELHRPGLALAGYVELFTFQRIQILGNTEIQYLENLSKNDCIVAFEHITQFKIPIIFLTNNNSLPENLLTLATEQGIPVVETPLETTQFMFILRDFLEDQFALQTVIHGSMVDVYGIGMLIAGKSGIGKSEVALDLVERGHRLVADDTVMITKKGAVLIASANDINKHFMEIRGLGIIDVFSMFGIRAIRYQKRLEVVIDLQLWEEQTDVDRTGLEKKEVSVLDINIPMINLPITPGKNITVIAEVIAMNHLLSHYGYEAAKVFQKRLEERIAAKKLGFVPPKRAIEYFESDFE